MSESSSIPGPDPGAEKACPSTPARVRDPEKGKIIPDVVLLVIMDETDDLFVASLMTTDLKTVTSDTLVEEAAELMLENAVGSVIVVDDGELAGILTRTDFVAIVAGQEPKDQTPVSEYMTTDVLTAKAGDSIRNVADRMVEASIHHMPVVDEEEGLIGIITTSDLTAYISTVQSPSP
jgi:CBS domain-containing protein